MKKIPFLCTALLLLAITCFPAGTAFAMPYFEDATVTSDEVNMRLRPTTDSPVVTKLPEGARVGVFCEETEGWYRVIYGNYRGYVSADYVFLPSADAMYGNVTQGGVNLRQNPGTYSTVIAELSEGTGLTILNFTGDWYHIQAIQMNTDGTTATLEGYVSKDYVQLSTADHASMLLKPGMSGAEVRNIQQKLRERGFMLAAATGYYGEITQGAVKAFQRKAGISADGIVGEATYEMLFSDNDISITAAELLGITGEVKLSSWDEINKLWKKGTSATVTDVKTGLQYTAYRFGGWYHADCEPKTAADTAIMKKMFGGSWSWNRRAIWVTLSNGVTYAASQHGMPHMVDPVPGNDFPGHFCIHFYHSKVHETEAECPRHQACVMYAYNTAH
jgi:Putative peptidoglycan-binding domain-containing protein